MDILMEGKKDGFDYRVFTEIDESPDTSYLGEYTDELEMGVIVRFGENPGEFWENLTDEEQENIPEGGREYTGFKPYAGGEKVGTDNYKKYGKQDYKRMQGLSNGDWCYLGIIAKVSKNGIELGEFSVWGFESNSGNEYLKDEAKNILSEAIAEAKTNLHKLCSEKETV